MRTEKPYGSWPSQLTADVVATAGTRLAGARVDRAGRVLWWEGRPLEGGRGVVVARAADGVVADVTPQGSNVRSRVHEYDGGSWTVLADSTVAYVDNADQNIWLVPSAGDVRQLTEGDDTVRFGDLTPGSGALFAVRETHGADEPSNELVSIDLETGQQTVLASGRDFYSSPRQSPDGTQLAYICWDHPNMPWNSTELHSIDLSTAELNDVLLLAGASIQQPTWMGEHLVAISDVSGYWLPYRLDGPGATTPLVDPDTQVELGVPPWVFGMCTLVEDDARLFAVAQIGGLERLVEIVDGELIEVDCDRVAFDSIAAAGGGRVVACAASSSRASEVVLISSEGIVETIVRSDPPIGADDVSVATHVSFASGSRTAHALFYAPKSTVAIAPEGERPPLVVLSHGGPTSSARGGLNLSIQYWTQRGFAVVDVNYGGSTGYGTEFRNALDGQWGVVDVEDCIAAARHLASSGLVDVERWAIKGGSAGGYTTLAALTFHDDFAAGISRYGIGDLETLARDTHKFESRYLDRLIGPYPQRADLYRERSPINSVERLNTPMLILQGDEDPVVPPNQAQAMADALAERGVPHALLMFEGESHGFRRADTIVRSIEAEYVFLCQIFGIEASGGIEPVPLTKGSTE